MRGSWRDLGWMGGLALGYGLAVYLGLQFVSEPQGIAAIWPASGVALAALLLRPRTAWPAALGVILVINGLANWLGGNSLVLSLWLALANSAEALLAALLLEGVLGHRTTFAQLKEVVWLVVLAMGLGNGVTALLGAAGPALLLGASFWSTWLVWWIADGLGMLLLAPLLVTWWHRPWRFLTLARAAEASLLLALLAAACWSIFMTPPAQIGPLSYPFLLFPLLIWAAVRFGPSGATAGLLLMAGISLVGSNAGCGLFAALSAAPLDHLMTNQLFLAVMGSSSLMLAAAIAEIHQAREQLQQERDRARRGQERLDLALEAADLGMWDWDVPSGRVDFNERWCSMLGYRTEEIPGHVSSWEKLVHPEDWPSIHATLDPHLKGEIPAYKSEHRVRHRDGHWVWILDQGKVMARDAEGRPLRMTGIHLDISARKWLEEELVRTQRLRAVGEVATGISHNFNNLLTGVLVPAEMVQLSSNDPKIQRLAATIIESATRAADLVLRLNHSVRGTAEPVQPVALKPALEAVLEMARPQWHDEPAAQGRPIEVFIEVGEVPRIRAVHTGLHEVLTNLLFNAVEAMPQGGTITIRAWEEKTSVRLEFCDTGVGMDETTRLRAFEPFFTTKMTVGNGLGLSVLHNNVTQWGGRVEVFSEPGQGTTFLLCLPVWLEEEAAAPPPEPAPAVRPGQVLVVEDDPAVSQVLAEVLGARNQVEVFADAEQALAGFGAGKYEVAVVDLGLPGIAGDELARRLGELDPALARILITGWQLEIDDDRARPFDFVVQKPLRAGRELEELVGRAVELHDRRTSGG